MIRADGRYAKTCHECGYDLPDAEPGDRCPECGTVFTGELPSPGAGPASSAALGSSVVALVMAFVPIFVIPTVFSAFVAISLCGFVLKHTHPDRRPAPRHIKRARRALTVAIASLLTSAATMSIAAILRSPPFSP